MAKSLAPLTHRNATSSSATDVAIDVATMTGASTHQSSPKQRQPVGHVGADGDELAVGEVDHAHHPEGQADSQGQQGVLAAEAETVDQLLYELDHHVGALCVPLPRNASKRSSRAASSPAAPRATMSPLRMM